MNNQGQITLQRTPDGQAILPSATLTPEGKPRFVMKLVPELIKSDAGVSYMVRHELLHDGFERITRDIVDMHLQEDDVFVDIGAHWGIMALSAATRFPGRIEVLAVEPHPLNVNQLMQSVGINRLGQQIEIVAAAAGDRAGTARLAFNSTMGHSLLESANRSASGMHLRVPVVTIDQLMADRPDLAGRRIVIKIDVEGFEAQVLAGARQTLESGRVALLVWERGQDYRVPERRDEVERSIAWLSSLGYRHYAQPYIEWGGPLVPLVPDVFLGNIFSFAPGIEKRSLYPQAFAKRPPFNASFRLQRTSDRLADVTNMVIAHRSSDGVRWADPDQVIQGARERAVAAAQVIAAGASVLDLGAGAQALRSALPPGCSYLAADLIARSEACQIVDLNQGQFPGGRYDVAALLEVLEYLHDPLTVLRQSRAAAERLVVIYTPFAGPDAQVIARRQRGFVNDLSAGELEGLLHQAGWKIDAR
ncbi:MAG: FkbM family methyltransferase, partial [Rhodospirillales bacterium]